MEFTREEYSKHYIVQALFFLMRDRDYAKISITDIAEKAGVGRVTFYRYFKKKEDVLLYYFDRNAREFMYDQRTIPRCREDYFEIVQKVLAMFYKHRELFRLIRKARLEYVYSDFLNRQFVQLFEQTHPDKSRFLPYIYAGMLFNVSMAWLDADCAEPAADIARALVDAIYHGS